MREWSVLQYVLRRESSLMMDMYVGNALSKACEEGTGVCDEFVMGWDERKNICSWMNTLGW